MQRRLKHLCAVFSKHLQSNPNALGRERWLARRGRDAVACVPACRCRFVLLNPAEVFG